MASSSSSSSTSSSYCSSSIYKSEPVRDTVRTLFGGEVARERQRATLRRHRIDDPRSITQVCRAHCADEVTAQHVEVMLLRLYGLEALAKV